MNKLTITLLFGIFLIAYTNAFAANELIGLGDLPGGVFNSESTAISANGSVAVGISSRANDSGGGGGWEAFRWTQDGGMEGLGDLPGGTFSSNATDVNADGSVVVGYGNVPGVFGAYTYKEAFRWTQAGEMVGLGGLNSEATGVSADGSVVVGTDHANGSEAFRWTQTGGMIGLGDLPGGSFSSEAWGVSADGSVVVGKSHSTTGMFGEAFRWTQDGGMEGLGDLPGGNFQSYAYGVSADGSVVVGRGISDSGQEAFRWTQDGGMEGLGDLPGGNFQSYAYGVSADGSVVVGWGTSDSGQEAFRWTQTGGMQTVTDWLADADVTVSGWTLSEARDVSADGSVVVGRGTSTNGPEAWIARLVPWQPVVIDIKPDGFPNSINPKNKGKIPVAVLTEDTFDATNVAEFTVLFGPTGTEAAPVRSALEDVDGDGDIDLILHFNTQDAGIECTETSGFLTGETFSGQAIQGSDYINTEGCK